jgi:hypothetical protein
MLPAGAFICPGGKQLQVLAAAGQRRCPFDYLDWAIFFSYPARVRCPAGRSILPGESGASVAGVQSVLSWMR